MLHVNGTTADHATGGQPSADPGTDEIVEGILGELEPIMTRTREALVHVWNDRSVSKTNLHILMLLDQLGRQPMSRLATLADVSMPNMTAVIDRMAEHGLVERARGDDDRRVVLVSVTDQGRAILDEFQAVRREYLRRVINAMRDGDRRTCYAAFRAFRRVADELEAQQNATTSTDSPAGAGEAPEE
jgi:DNA-binding MarR family transcriptional regulator